MREEVDVMGEELYLLYLLVPAVLPGQPLAPSLTVPRYRLGLRLARLR